MQLAAAARPAAKEVVPLQLSDQGPEAPGGLENEPSARPRGRTPGPIGEAWIDDLPVDECLRLLRASTVGRIAVVVDGFPLILPVNHRLVDFEGEQVVCLRTRAGTSLDSDAARVAFQVDGFDVHEHEGWSVLVRGSLRHVDESALGGTVLVSWADQREVWLVVVPETITGRRLHAPSTEWPFSPQAYL